jgi:voltage-gated sodium channel
MSHHEDVDLDLAEALALKPYPSDRPSEAPKSYGALEETLSQMRSELRNFRACLNEDIRSLLEEKLKAVKDLPSAGAELLSTDTGGTGSGISRIDDGLSSRLKQELQSLVVEGIREWQRTDESSMASNRGTRLHTSGSAMTAKKSVVVPAFQPHHANTAILTQVPKIMPTQRHANFDEGSSPSFGAGDLCPPQHQSEASNSNEVRTFASVIPDKPTRTLTPSGGSYPRPECAVPAPPEVAASEELIARSSSQGSSSDVANADPRGSVESDGQDVPASEKKAHKYSKKCSRVTIASDDEVEKDRDVKPTFTKSSTGMFKRSASMCSTTGFLTTPKMPGIRDGVFIHKVADNKPSVFSGAFHEEESWLRNIVESFAFDIFVGFLIFANGIWIGIQTAWLADHGPEALMPGFFKAMDTLFCILFSIEIGLRLYIYRVSFFIHQGWEWNLFDFGLVIMQISEEIVVRISEESSSLGNTSFLRVLRILRLIRVVRMIRIVRMIGELRTIIASILGSLKSLVWTVVVLLLIIYLVAILFTQIVADHAYEHADLDQYYGSLFRSVLSLFEAFTGGVDWDILAQPLVDIHWIYGVIFVLYIAFALFAMMNVVTGVFVETALTNARQDKDSDLVNLLREVFMKADDDGSGTMTWEEFEKSIEDPQMDAVFKVIDLDRSEAKGLFQLIDVYDQGEIAREEFILGCLRLQGTAKALDLATLMYDNKRLAMFLQTYLEDLEESVTNLANTSPVQRATLKNRRLTSNKAGGTRQSTASVAFRPTLSENDADEKDFSAGASCPSIVNITEKPSQESSDA